MITDREYNRKKLNSFLTDYLQTFYPRTSHNRNKKINEYKLEVLYKEYFLLDSTIDFVMSTIKIYLLEPKVLWFKPKWKNYIDFSIRGKFKKLKYKTYYFEGPKGFSKILDLLVEQNLNVAHSEKQFIHDYSY